MEIWLIYSLILVFFSSAAAITEKKALIKEHAMEFSAVLAILTLLISLPLFILVDFSRLNFISLALLLFNSILASVAFLFMTKAVRHMKITDSSSLLSIGPGITVILALIFLGETLTLRQTGGIVLLIVGTYVLEIKKNLSFLTPIRIFRKSKYTQYVLISIIIYGVTSILDKIILTNYNMQPEAFIAFAHVFICFHFILMLLIYHNGIKGIKHGLKTFGWLIFLVAIFTVGYRLAQAEAVKIANVGTVVAIKKTSVLLTVLIGGEIFHEKNIVRKIIAAFIIVVGAVLIAI